MGPTDNPHLPDDVLFRTAAGEPAGEYSTHLADCRQCARRLEAAFDSRRMLGELRFDTAEEHMEAGAECFAPHEWALLAAGSEDDTKSEAMLLHAGQCAMCAALLKASFEEEAEAGEDPAPAGSSEFLAAQLRRRPAKQTPRRWRWAAVAAAGILAVPALVQVYRILRPQPAVLLAQSYTEARPFLPRLAGVKHAPVRQVRAGAESLNRPTLTRAAAAIQKRSSDSEHLIWAGTYELLTLNTDRAIELLEEARGSFPAREDVALLVGVAYYQRGAVTARREDFMHALDQFSALVRKNPNFLEARFNLALVYEKLEMQDSALTAWKEYLKLDGASDWAVEARENVRRLDELLKKRKAAVSRLTSDPAAWLRQDGAGIAPEFFYFAAWSAWLPSSGNREAREALVRLGKAALSAHRDSTFAELLSAPVDEAAARGLGEAILINRNAEGNEQRERAAALAQQSALRFRSSASRPAWFRARAERLYSLHLLYRTKACLDEARELDRDLTATSYEWLKAQVRLELANCLSFSNDYAAAIQAAEQARMIAANAGLEELELRALGLASGFRVLAGDLSSVMERDGAGLSRFWQAPFGPLRAQQFFHNAVRAAESLGFDDAAYEFARSRLEIMEPLGATLMQARGHAQLAVLAGRLGNVGESRRQAEQAQGLFEKLSTPEDRMRLDAEIDLLEARLQLKPLGEPAILARLETIAQSPPTVDAGLRASELAAAWSIDAADRAIRVHEVRLRKLEGWNLYQAILQQAGLYRAKASWHLAHGQQMEALAAWLSARGRTFTRKDVEVMRGQLPADTAVVLAAISGSVHEWTIGKRGVEHTQATLTAAELHRSATELRRLTSNPSAPPLTIEKAADRLRIALFGSGGVPSGSVLIATDRIAAGIPWHLVLPGATALAVQVTACCTQEQKLRLFTGRVLSPTVAEPFSSLYPPLADAELEAEEIAAVASSRVQRVRGPDATPAAIVGDADFFHFVGHATPAGLVLAGPAGFTLVGPGTVAGAAWKRTELASLSACGTAVGTRTNLGSEAMVDGFLAGGVPNVTASLWNVDAAATRALMRAFYGNLSYGDRPSYALVKAVKLLKENPAWRHPYYWAAFQLYH